MKLINLSTGMILAETVELADTFSSRLKGLMFREKLPENQAMQIKPCKSIHTFFMRFPIDVLYLDDENTIVGIEEKLLPGKIGAIFRESKTVVEFSGGKIHSTHTKVGQVVRFE